MTFRDAYKMYTGILVCFGYFPSYGMGMLFAAQLYDRLENLVQA
ncbi:hypothetical protein MHYMCMPSP_01026 [Hyalomma marginatum]|uniref:Uncharacterized protein n=1 Tax=Hyalomma marginatum TaxID=34627 RepID=A0A8S4C3B8_9ACAR|nr:hypothetical protein MHYMCMPSP_01026 [Hyalomma marginatum]CAG7598242.1 hypothetical protein MHYMCMPASI_01001 [Hyalomma marginatum]